MSYEEEGFVFPDFRISLDFIREIKEYVRSVISPDRNMAVINPHLNDLSNNNPLIRFAGNIGLLDLIESLMGPDILLWKVHILNKEKERPVNWHQDSSYYKMDPISGLTVWLALDDVSKENGCMIYGKGTHKLGLIEHETTEDRVFRSVVSRKTIEMHGLNKRENVVDVQLEAGQIAIHHINLLHCSRPNIVAKPRMAVGFRYMSGDSLLHEEPTGRFKVGCLVMRGSNKQLGNRIVNM